MFFLNFFNYFLFFYLLFFIFLHFINFVCHSDQFIVCFYFYLGLYKYDVYSIISVCEILNLTKPGVDWHTLTFNLHTLIYNLEKQDIINVVCKSKMKVCKSLPKPGIVVC